MKNKLVLMVGEDFYGNVGEPTPYKDENGEPLYVGDIVRIESKHTASTHTKFVVKNKSVFDADDKPFVMGIEISCNERTGEIERWKVTKVTSFEDVPAGKYIAPISCVISEEADESCPAEDSEQESSPLVGTQVVVFTNAEKHDKDPTTYPEVGTVGLVRNFDKLCDLVEVMWKSNGKMVDDTTWWCSTKDIVSCAEYKSKFAIGSKVRFISARAHEREPRYYPIVGTVGEIVDDQFSDFIDNTDGLMVKWEAGTTSDNDIWFCDFNFVELIDESHSENSKKASELWGKILYFGEMGQRTPYKDADGNVLYTGDVVEVIGKSGLNHGEVFVVSTEIDGMFVHGILDDCDEETGEIKNFTVKRVKGYKEVTAGTTHLSITAK